MYICITIANKVPDSAMSLKMLLHILYQILFLAGKCIISFIYYISRWSGILAYPEEPKRCVNRILRSIEEGRKNDVSGDDLTTLVKVGLMKGNNVEKIQRILPEPLLTQFQKALKSYHPIYSNIKRERFSSSDLTLPRIRLAVPMLTAKVLTNDCEVIRCRLVSLYFLNENYAHPYKWPTVLRDTSIAALIPRKSSDTIGKDIIEACLQLLCCHDYEESKIIKSFGSNNTTDDRSLFNYANHFVRLAWKSTHTDEKIRNSFMLQYADQLKDVVEIYNCVLEKKDFWEDKIFNFIMK